MNMHKLGDSKARILCCFLSSAQISSVHNKDVRIQRLVERFEITIPQVIGISVDGPFANKYSKKKTPEFSTLSDYKREKPLVTMDSDEDLGRERTIMLQKDLFSC